MKNFKLLPLLPAGFMLAAHAAPPTAGPYVTDPQSEYVQDQTSEGLKQANNILCYMSNTRPDAMVNKGRYVAFIDETKCDTSSRDDPSNSASEGGGQTTKYTRMSLTSTRADNTSPQIVKGHAAIKMGPNNVPAVVYINANATAEPSATAPNGAVTMNLGGLASDGTKMMRGKISASGTTLTFSWATSDGQGHSQNYRLYVDGNDSAGKGAIVFPDKQNNSVTLTFGYNSTHFCRSDGSTERCFLRSKDAANSTVWRYGVYDDSTGARYDIAQPGFPVKNDATGEYGFASYWGIWFPTAVVDGTAIKSADGATSYTVFKTKGRLIKYSKVKTTLDSLNRVPFNTRLNNSAGSFTVATQNGIQGANYELYWDKVNKNFVVTNILSCVPSSPCYKTQMATGTTLTAAELKTAIGGFGGAMGWSEALGGQVMLSDTALSSATPGSENVAYNTQSTVLPGDTSVPTTLKCARNCPTATLLATTSPYTTGTNMKGGGTLAADVVTYTWSPSTYQLKDATSTALSNDLLPSGTSLSQFASSGISTGALVDASPNNTNWTSTGTMSCGGNSGAFCDFKANNLEVYYVWQNGTQDFNAANFLKKSDGSYIAFSPPQSATFAVPDKPAFGEYAGANMNLQFGGFGNLWGIPGKCFSPQTNQPADCSSSTRFVPAFSIPANTATTYGGKLTIGGATKWVKFLDREIRFKLAGVVGSNGYARPADITLGNTNNLPAAMSLSTADTENPSDSTNSNYAGSVQKSDFSTAPSVIHGVVQ